MNAQSIQSPADALEFLQSLKAPVSLIRHAELVSQVAAEILDCLNLPPEAIDSSHLLIGAVLHDVGKIEHPEELRESGHQHEAAGRTLLISYGFMDDIADICVTHAQWQDTVSLEALVIALADKLWKGKRVAKLEDRVIQHSAELRHEEFWSIYPTIEKCFDQIADSAPDRLAKSTQ